MNVIVGMVLVLLGIEDMRTKKLPIWAVGTVLVAATVYGICNISIWQCFLGMLPGTLLIALSLLGAQIGMGDGLITLSYGVVYGWYHSTIWIMFSFFLVALIGLLWKLLCRKKKLELPFVPFMAIVHIGMCV